MGRRLTIQRIFAKCIEEGNGIWIVQRGKDQAAIQNWNAAQSAKEKGSVQEEGQFEEEIFKKEGCVKEKDCFEKEIVKEESCNKEEDRDEKKEFVKEEEFFQKGDGIKEKDCVKEEGG